MYFTNKTGSCKTTVQFWQKVHGVDITHDNVCSSMLSCFYSYVAATINRRPISSYCYYLPPADRPGTGDYKMPSVRACVRVCVRSSRFYKSLSISKTMIARASKFAGYIHHSIWKNLPGNLFLLILKNKMAATGVNKMAAVDFFLL